MPGIIAKNHIQTGLPAYEDMNGHVRHLALHQSDPSARKMMKSASSVFQLIPRSQWRNIDRRTIYGDPKWTLNQKQTSGCVGFSAAGATMISRDLRGMSYAKLSGSYVYSWINGGRDAGANILDALNELTLHGTCLDSTCPVNSIYRSQSKVGDTEAQRFRIATGLGITDGDQGSAFDWVCSIIQAGGIAQFAIEVGNNFESFDANGVAGYSAGYGNHSVFASGMIQINETWYLTMQNSWGAWGPWSNGYVLLSERHIMGVVQAGGQDAYGHVDELSDPQDPTNPTLPV